MSEVKIVQPAEWEKHSAVWLAWPSHENLWQENLPAAREEFVGLASSISDELLNVLVPNEEQKKLAQTALKGLRVEFHLVPFGDIWLRDTGPIFVRETSGKILAHAFGFNGWGEKYLLDHDDKVSGQISERSKLKGAQFSWILEGGSVDVNGEGVCLTTRQCLLNPNRNPGLTQKDMEEKLREGLGVTRVVWLDRGLVNDHTDGHIDTLARFVGPNKVICMEEREKGDPNSEALQEIKRDLLAAGFEVVTVPSPGKITDEDGKIMAASFVNFYIANKSVVVPTYGSPWDAEAVAGIAACFPGRKTVGRSAKAILSGGGAFHCISQQQPV